MWYVAIEDGESMLKLTLFQAETKGRMYRRIASDLSFSEASRSFFRADTQSTTSVAVCPPYAYTVSKDITIIKWELYPPRQPTTTSTKEAATTKESPSKPKKPPPPRRKPKQVAYTRGSLSHAKSPSYRHHTASILAIAASSDGKFLATGGRDKRLIVWDAATLKPLRVFTQHRDAVIALAFRRGTNQLFSASADRTIKTWSLNELAYVETLFGHQDAVVDIAALAQEHCVSVGARDRTARLWKVVEESQLVFRGGTTDRDLKRSKVQSGDHKAYAEGSIDRIAMIDEDTFVTGSDNGSLSLWATHKKKPLHTLPLAHGADPPLPPDEATAELKLEHVRPGLRQARWITALAAVPYSDLILSGSWDGSLRAWRVSEDKKKLEAICVVGHLETPSHSSTVNNSILPINGDDATLLPSTPDNAPENENASQQQQVVRGIINDIAVFERGDRGKDGLCVVVAVGKEQRLGEWKKIKGQGAKNGAVVFEVPRMRLEKVTETEKAVAVAGEDEVIVNGHGSGHGAAAVDGVVDGDGLNDAA